jgi:hypothetical protein
MSTPGQIPVILEADAIEGPNPNGTLKFYVDVQNINKLPNSNGAEITVPNKPVVTRKFDFETDAAGAPLLPGSTLVDGGGGTPYFVANQATQLPPTPSDPTKTTASDNPRVEVDNGNGVILVQGGITTIDLEYSFTVYAVWDFGGTNDVFAVLGKTTYNVEFNESMDPTNQKAVPLGNDAINPSTHFERLDPTSKPTAYKPRFANDTKRGWY